MPEPATNGSVPAKAQNHIENALLLLAALFLLIPATLQLLAEWRINPNSGHVVMVLPVGIYLLVKRLKNTVQTKPYWLCGIPLLILGGAFFFIDIAITEPFALACGLLCGGLATVALLHGKNGSKYTLFPFLILSLCMPLPGIVASNIMHIYLQRAGAAAAGGLLDLCSIETDVAGTIIHLQNGALNVLEQCSGLKFITTLFFGALITGLLIIPQMSVGRAILAACGLLIAFIVNVIRLFIGGIIHHFYDADAADTFFHGGIYVLPLYVIGVFLLMTCAYFIKGFGCKQIEIKLSGSKNEIA